MAEGPTHDGQLLAILEHQRRVAMAETMEPLNVPSHQGPALMRREDVALVNPARAGSDPLFELPTPMLSQCVYDGTGDPKGAAGPFRLRLRQRARPAR